MDDAILPPEAYFKPEEIHWHESTTAASGNEENPEQLRPPKYTVDLSLPPEQRWLHIAPDFLHCIQDLPELLRDVTNHLVPWIPGFLVRFLCKILLRRMYDEDEHKELRGIAKAIDFDLYLLIALNTFLDLVMGCTAGGVRTRATPRSVATKMLHLRTLDWTMDPLRKLVIEVDFIDSEASANVLYTSITYFGYIGVLTAVKPGLSLAFNSRLIHDESTIKKRIAFRWHQALVLLGKRRGIASELRKIMEAPLKSPLSIAEEMQHKHSTAGYITLCDGQNTVVLDNDNCSGLIRQDPELIIAVNHDVTKGQESVKSIEERYHAGTSMIGMGLIVWLSTERQECIEGLWARDAVKRRNKSSVTQDQLVNWIETSRTISEDETHFGTIMDPTEGKIVWLQRYIEPLRWYRVIDTPSPDETTIPPDEQATRQGSVREDSLE